MQLLPSLPSDFSKLLAKKKNCTQRQQNTRRLLPAAPPQKASADGTPHISFIKP